MPKTIKVGDERFRKVRSFKTRRAADTYAKNCRRRGFKARVMEQSGPRIKNPWAVFVKRS